MFTGIKDENLKEIKNINDMLILNLEKIISKIKKLL